MLWKAILLLVIILVVISILAPLRVKIVYQRQKNIDYALLEFIFWGLLPFRFKVPFAEVPPGTKKPVFKIKKPKKKKKYASSAEKSVPGVFNKGIFKKVSIFKPHIIELIKNIKIQRFSWDTELGFSDAALTGMSVAALWSIKGTVLSIFYNFMGTKTNPRVVINPVYGQNLFTTSLNCIFEIRPGHIIITALKILSSYVIDKKRQRYRGEKYAGATSH
ncbi:MAG: DUF2953 domain-containing protein [Clostridiales bacterium]|nr:DUF2953 domain-containing protein [Clostridiales bacterium]MCF8021244.1 DUF2953 domain-containing protein [Clostridiales bacterium]